MKTYIIIDFEATCSNTEEFPRSEMEIIEIGAVVYQDGEETKALSLTVKPERNPILTDFCKELTGITQTMVENGISFPEAMTVLNLFMQGLKDPTFCSWGDYDKNQLEKDCKYHEVRNPFADEEHINIKKRFSDYLGTTKRFGVEKALNKLGLKFEGNQHRALNDAKNISKIFEIISKSA